MALPKPEEIDKVTAQVTAAAAQGLDVLGFKLDAGVVQAIMQTAVDAMCMKAWRQAQAAGAAAAAAITTEDQAEAAQRKP